MGRGGEKGGEKRKLIDYWLIPEEKNKSLVVSNVNSSLDYVELSVSTTSFYFLFHSGITVISSSGSHS